MAAYFLMVGQSLHSIVQDLCRRPELKCSNAVLQLP